MKVKNVPMLAGIPWDAALVSLGWLSFSFGMLIPGSIVGAILMVIARVLPKAIY